MTDVASVAADQLRSLIERIENVEAEIKDLSEAKSEIYSEAKGAGFDTGILRKIVALRKKAAAEREEEAAIMELYMQALGMPA